MLLNDVTQPIRRTGGGFAGGLGGFSKIAFRPIGSEFVVPHGTHSPRSAISLVGANEEPIELQSTVATLMPATLISPNLSSQPGNLYSAAGDHSIMRVS